MLTEEQVRRLRYAPTVWTETTRLHPASPHVMRVACEDVVLRGSGTSVGRETEIFAMVRAA